MLTNEIEKKWFLFPEVKTAVEPWCTLHINSSKAIYVSPNINQINTKMRASRSIALVGQMRTYTVWPLNFIE